ncbi:MAG: sigma-70 family RNA polymerase sigma factor [Planctomycetota bacterium]
MPAPVTERPMPGVSLCEDGVGEGEVTLLLAEIRDGSKTAADQLIELVYNELRQMAAAKMTRELEGHTLQPTALVHDAFLRLVGNCETLEDRGHFFGAAARAMERVLVDHARRRLAIKRGGGAHRLTLHELHGAAAEIPQGVLEVHEAVEALDRESPELASLVRYRCFVGLTLQQLSEIEGMSLATVKRRWTFAKAWLHDRLSDVGPVTEQDTP